MASRITIASLLLLVSVSAALALKPAEPRNRKDPPPLALKKVQFPGGSCDLYLLAQEDVQKDLGLSQDQVSAVQTLVADLINKKTSHNFRDHVKLLLKHEDTMRGLLAKEQIQRLKQVSLQCKATASFWDPEVRTKLQITAEQFQKMQAIPYGKQADETAEERALVRQTFLPYPKRAAEEWQQREWACIAVLSPTQRENWKGMLGQPFASSFPTAIYVPLQPKKFDFDR